MSLEPVLIQQILIPWPRKLLFLSFHNHFRWMLVCTTRIKFRIFDFYRLNFETSQNCLIVFDDFRTFLFFGSPSISSKQVETSD